MAITREFVCQIRLPPRVAAVVHPRLTRAPGILFEPISTSFDPSKMLSDKTAE
jgi:hypothetical protein